jgi:hypothetical protein
MTQKHYQVHPLCKKMRPLTKEERGHLEDSIKEAGGATDPIKLWHESVIDGANRQEICIEQGLPFQIVDMTVQLADLAAVEQWILLNQLGRRNLSGTEASLLRGRYYNLIKKDPHRPASTGREVISTLNERNTLEGEGTADQVAAELGVSRSTIVRDGQLAEAFDKMSPEEKERVRSGKITKREVLEKAAKTRPKKEKKAEYAVGKSTATDFIESQARRLAHALNRFKGAFESIREASPEDMAALPAPVRATREIMGKFISKMTIELDELSDVFLCLACEGAGCADCRLGYADADAWRYQQRKLEEDPAYAGSKILQRKTPAAPEVSSP